MPSPDLVARAAKLRELATRRLVEARQFGLEQARLCLDQRRIYLPGLSEPNIPRNATGADRDHLHDLSCFDHPETHPAERVEIMHRELPPRHGAGRPHHRDFRHPPRVAAALWRGRIAHDRHAGRRPRFALAPGCQPASALAGWHALSPGNYLLRVGTLEPRKNLTTLFRGLFRGLPTLCASAIRWLVVGHARLAHRPLMASAAN